MAAESSDDFSDIETSGVQPTGITPSRGLDQEFDDFDDDMIEPNIKDTEMEEELEETIGNDISEPNELTPMSNVGVSEEITPLNYKIGNVQKPETNVNQSSLSNNDFYNPRDYDSINIGNEAKRLFEYIEMYKPIEIDLDTELKVFIPDYIASIGNVDSFIKPARPDTKDDIFGLKCLNECKLQQSDESTLDLKLKSMLKLTNLKFMKIRSIERADKNPLKITNWIESIKKIKTQAQSQATKTNFNAINNMPDLEELMQPWKPNMDQYFRDIINSRDNENDPIPPYNIDLTLSQYASIICNIFDIPINSNDNIIPSLHRLFSLYAMFKESNQSKN